LLTAAGFTGRTASEPGKLQSRPPIAEAVRMKILAVDDDMIARILINGMVTALGHQCVLAESGEQAWELVQQQSFDVVISDRMMPGMNGLELCRRIRENTPAAEYVYVILASALTEQEEARDAMLAGADDYLTKPMRRRKLELKLIAAERVSSLYRRLAAVHSELRETTEVCSRSNLELSQAVQLQADMMAMLGHDARQPLSAVIGLVEAVLEEWPATPEPMKIKYLTRAADAARRVDGLIEDVLTLGNLDSGTISVRTQPVVLAPILADAIMAVVGDSPVPVVALAADPKTQALVDPWQLRQIITNLITNARKYGADPLSVTVHSGPAIDIEVRDSGEGVPPEFVPQLFDRFTRAQTGIATEKPGTGFGLYIVRRLVEANQGTITYRPGESRGSVFTVTLPAAVPGAPETVPGVAETVRGVAETVRGVAETVRDVAETVPGIGETAPGIGETVPSAAETVPGVAENPAAPERITV
jgi:signal transduction histidine kinase